MAAVVIEWCSQACANTLLDIFCGWGLLSTNNLQPPNQITFERIKINNQAFRHVWCFIWLKLVIFDASWDGIISPKLRFEGVTKKPYKPIPIELFKIFITYKKSTNILSLKHIQNGGPLKLISRLILTSNHFWQGFYFTFVFILPCPF